MVKKLLDGSLDDLGRWGGMSSQPCTAKEVQVSHARPSKCTSAYAMLGDPLDEAVTVYTAVGDDCFRGDNAVAIVVHAVRVGDNSVAALGQEIQLNNTQTTPKQRQKQRPNNGIGAIGYRNAKQGRTSFRACMRTVKLSLSMASSTRRSRSATMLALTSSVPNTNNT